MSDESIYIRLLEPGDAEALLNLRVRNREFYQPFEPIRDEVHYTPEGQRKEIADTLQAAIDDQAYSYGVFLQGTDELIGKMALSGVARGFFQNCNLGYYLDQRHNGKGFATKAASLCLAQAFGVHGLHRVSAGVMPWNTASIRVLEKAGFRREGLALSYLRINGKWEDHVLFAVTADER